MKNSFSIYPLALVLCGVNHTGYAHAVVRIEAGGELQDVQPDWQLDASQIWRPRISEETNHSSSLRHSSGVPLCQVSQLAETIDGIQVVTTATKDCNLGIVHGWSVAFCMHSMQAATSKATWIVDHSAGNDSLNSFETPYCLVNTEVSCAGNPAVRLSRKVISSETNC
jgi:hypothetical protein